MPQFELEVLSPRPAIGLYRGRSPDDAVRMAAGLDDSVRIEVAAQEDVQGWREITVDGLPAGRVRLHQRMRFRRD
jgi:hypothetical protein